MTFAFRREFITEPFARLLRERGWSVIASEHPDELLMTGEAQIVMTPPAEYARNIGVVDYSLVPGVVITTSGFAGLVRLAFNPGLLGVGSIAAKDPRSSEAMVARILMQEKHEIEPSIVPVPADSTLADMLSAADAALLVGDDAAFGSQEHETVIDLSDEWNDLTGEPLPYMLLWGRTHEVPASALDELVEVREQAVLQIAGDAAAHANTQAASALQQSCLRGDIRFELDDAAIAALDTFFRYTFYHGVIPDIPALKILPDGQPVGGTAEKK